MKRKGLIFIIVLFLPLCLMAQGMFSLIPYLDNGKYGYCDSNKTIRIRPQWDKAELFHNGKATVFFRNYRGLFSPACIIDTAGNYIVPPEYHWDGTHVTTGLNAHNDQNKYGIIDTLGNILIPFLYDKDSHYNYFRTSYNHKLYYMIIGKDGKLGIIDSQNKILIPFAYDRLSEMYAKSGIFFMGWKANDNNWSIINLQNKIILENPNPRLSDNVTVTHGFGQEGFLVNEDSLSWSFADTNGNYLIRNRNKKQYSLLGNYLYDHSRKKPRLYDLQGKLVLEGRKGEQFQERNDTLIWQKNKYKKKKYKYNGRKYFVYSRAYRNYNLTTLLPLDSMEHIEQWGNRVSIPYCVSDYRVVNEARYNPSIRGKSIFAKDGQKYYTIRCRLAPNRLTVVQQKDKSMSQDKKNVFAVIDTNFHFLTPPQDSLLLYRYNRQLNRYYAYNYNCRQYCLVDSNLKTSYTSPYKIRNIKSSGTKYYALVDTNQHRTENWRKTFVNTHLPISYYSYGERLADPDGNLSETARELKNFTFIPSFLKKDSWIIKAKDGNGKKGFIALDGATLLPAISFKYGWVNRIAGNVFFVKQKSEDPSGILVDSNNNRLHPEDISVSSSFNVFSGLHRFSYTKHNAFRKYEFYVGRNGEIFVGEW